MGKIGNSECEGYYTYAEQTPHCAKKNEAFFFSISFSEKDNDTEVGWSDENLLAFQLWKVSRCIGLLRSCMKYIMFVKLFVRISQLVKNKILGDLHEKAME